MRRRQIFAQQAAARAAIDAPGLLPSTGDSAPEAVPDRSPPPVAEHLEFVEYADGLVTLEAFPNEPPLVTIPEGTWKADGTFKPKRKKLSLKDRQ